MADRSARVTLDLNPSSFISGMNRLVGTAVGVGKKIGSALSGPAEAGFDKLKSSLGGLGSSVKSVLGTAATLGGAVGFGALAKGAIDSEERYVQLAGAVEDFTGQAFSAAEAQAVVERAAAKSKGSIESLQDSFAQLAAAAPQDELADGLARAELQARRWGTTSEKVGEVYSILLTKGLAPNVKAAEGLTEQIAKFGRQTLGLNVQDAFSTNDIAEFAAFTQQADMNMAQSLALLKGQGGEIMKDLGQATMFVEEFGNVFNDVSSLEGLKKELKLTGTEINSNKTAVENFTEILDRAGEKGVKTVLDQFGNERTKAALKNLIGADLVSDIEAGKKEGIAGRLQTRAEEIRKGNEEASKATVDFAKIAQRNAALTGTSGAKLRDALNKVQTAFQQPAMIEAINSLAENAPELAQGFAKLVDFATNNPLLALGGIVGLKAGGSAAGAFAGDASKRLVVSGAKGLGKKIAGEFAETAASSGRWAAAGKTFAKVAGPAIAALVAFQLGKEAIDEEVAEKNKNAGNVIASAAQTQATLLSGNKSIEEKRKAVADFEQNVQRARQKSEDKGFFGGIVEAVSGVNVNEAQQLAVQSAERDLEAFKKALKEGGGDASKTGSALRSLANATKEATRELQQLRASKPGGGGGSSSNGLPPPASNAPGAA